MLTFMTFLHLVFPLQLRCFYWYLTIVEGDLECQRGQANEWLDTGDETVRHKVAVLGCVVYRADDGLQAGDVWRSAGSCGWIAAGLPARILDENISDSTVPPMNLPIYPTHIIGSCMQGCIFSHQVSSNVWISGISKWGARQKASKCQVKEVLFSEDMRRVAQSRGAKGDLGHSRDI